MYLLLRWFVLALGLVATSCQLIADIETHEPDPLPKTCVLPEYVVGSGTGRARLAHVLPTLDKIDVCMRASGTASYGRPVFRSSGADSNTICGGLKYPQVTAAFKIPVGKLDFKVIPAGKTCSVAALAEKTGVDVGTDFPLTLAYAGPPEGPGTLLTMLESTTAKVAQNRQTRFVNAISGSSLDWGVGAGGALPTNLQTPFLNTSLGFGQLATKNMANTGFEVDDQGYLSFSPFALAYGAAARGPAPQKMLFVGTLPQAAGFHTLYAIGSPGTAFPVRGLYCRDQEKDSTQTLQSCAETEVEAFKIDVFNAGLYGAFAVIESLRAPTVIQALAARAATSDLLCISEIARHDELDLPPEQKGWSQDALINAAKEAGFPYAASGKTTLDTPIDEPTNQQGEVPPEPGRAPCDAQADQAKVATVYDCLMNKCSTDPGKDTGVTAGGGKCYSETCGAVALAGLLFGTDVEKQCFNCIILNGISYKQWGEVRKQCATDTRRPYGFNGTSSSLLLSKAKLSEVDQYVLPTTTFRRAAIYAKMEYEADKSIDVYCIHAPPLLGGLMPYTGGYANNASTTNGAAWQEENVLGIQKVIGWIQRKSAGRPAIIMGDWSASATALDTQGNVINGLDGVPQIADVTPEGIRALQAAFTEAIPEEWKQQCVAASMTCQPQCTRCPGKDTMVPGRLRNPYNSFEEPFWNLRVYVKDAWATNPTTSAEVFYTDFNAVTFPMPTEFGLSGPLGDTFGFRVSVRRP